MLPMLAQRLAVEGKFSSSLVSFAHVLMCDGTVQGRTSPPGSVGGRARRAQVDARQVREPGPGRSRWRQAARTHPPRDLVVYAWLMPVRAAAASPPRRSSQARPSSSSSTSCRHGAGSRCRSGTRLLVDQRGASKADRWVQAPQRPPRRRGPRHPVRPSPTPSPLTRPLTGAAASPPPSRAQALARRTCAPPPRRRSRPQRGPPRRRRASRPARPSLCPALRARPSPPCRPPCLRRRPLRWRPGGERAACRHTGPWRWAGCRRATT
jgi:hypothetical protein